MASHVPPAGVRRAAKRGLELRRKFGRGGTRVGIARARDLARGAGVSDSTIKRMASYFARHAVDRKPGWGNPSNPTNGYIAWLLWGGNAGRSWAAKVKRSLDAKVRANPHRARSEVHARDALIEFEQLPEPYVAFYVGARNAALEYVEDQLIRMGTELTDKFLTVVQQIAPHVGVVSVNDQQALIGFYLAVPRAVFYLAIGRQDFAPKLLETVRARLINVVLDRQLRDVLLDPVVTVQLDRSWAESIPWFGRRMDALILETRTALYERVPELPAYLLAQGVTDEDFQLQLLARLVDLLPVATAEGGADLSGRFAAGDPAYAERLYGIRPL